MLLHKVHRGLSICPAHVVHRPRQAAVLLRRVAREGVSGAVPGASIEQYKVKSEKCRTSFLKGDSAARTGRKHDAIPSLRFVPIETGCPAHWQT